MRRKIDRPLSFVSLFIKMFLCVAVVTFFVEFSIERHWSELPALLLLFIEDLGPETVTN